MCFLSVVVTTYNRAETLRVTLNRLSDQTLPKEKYEVIVVDDGSPDHTPEMIADYQKTAAFRLKYLRHENAGPGFSQNRGIREATGPWVLLLADDIQPQPNLLAVHYEAHTEHPEPHVAVAGKVLQSPGLPRTVFQRNWDPFRYKNFAGFEELSYINFWACQVSFKKEFMLDHGMFAERRCCAHEDTEVGWRLYRHGGMRLLYRKDALAFHYHPETLDAACRRAYERGKYFDLLADNVDDPVLYIRYHFVPREMLLGVFQAIRQRRTGVLEEDRNAAWFFTREALRRVVFNRVTVPCLWVPLIRRAESSRILALLVKPLLLRGVVSYHFLRGAAEMRRHRARTVVRSP